MNNHIDTTMAQLFNAEELETLLAYLRAQNELLEKVSLRAKSPDELPDEFKLTGFQINEIIENLVAELMSLNGGQICLVILPSLIESVRRGQSG